MPRVEAAVAHDLPVLANGDRPQMSLQNVEGMWRYDIAQYALAAPTPVLDIPGLEANLFETQIRGITWLYATPRGILGDITGLGKTLHGLGLAALLKSKGELNRAVFCVLGSTVGQWLEEIAKFTPGLTAVTTDGLNKAERRKIYRADDWDILVTSYDLAWRDAMLLAQLTPDLLWCDESTSFKNPDTKTAEGLRLMSGFSRRVVCASATPIQNSLIDLYSQLHVLGLAGSPSTLFGDIEQFKATYCIMQRETVFVRGGRQRTREKIVGYRNLDHLVSLLSPYYLRRTEGSGDMPSVVPEDISVPMNADQRSRYEQYAAGRIDGYDVDPAGQATWMLQCANNLAVAEKDLALDSSGKLDWFMEALDGRLVNEDETPAKVVVFCRWLYGIDAITARLDAAGVGYGVIKGGMTGEERDQVRKDFWEDPDSRVCIITTAGEMGLNLQIARYVVCFDLMLNPARMEQILGRIKRSGSPHSSVFMLRLIASNSIEEGVLRLLQVKQSLADFVHGDVSDLFKELSPTEMGTIIRHGVSS